MKEVNSIITFYSFKGGVGRSMALANIGVLLAQRGRKVLMIDWDLEAPGLEKYFSDFKILKSKSGGLLDFLIRQVEAGKTDQKEFPDYSEYCSSIKTEFKGSLSIMVSGSQRKGYIKDIQAFNWKEFFKKNNGSAFIESFRKSLLKDYNFILIDSRTGLTDSGGVCTIQLPDILIPVFTANNQSIYGVKDIIQRAQNGRQTLPYDRSPLAILPLLSRFDTRTEYTESQKWLDLTVKEMSPFVDDWRSRTITTKQIFERTKVPHVAFFSFGEKLPVLGGSISDPESIGHSYDFVSKIIVNRFQGIEELLSPKGVPGLELDDSYQKEYLITRVDEQIAWYKVKANRGKWNFLMYRAISVILLLAIPVLIAFMSDTNLNILKIVIGVVAVLVVVLQVLNSVFNFESNWLNYRRIYAEMEKEKANYLSESGAYENATFQDFVRTIEGLINEESRPRAQSSSKGEGSQTLYK